VNGLARVENPELFAVLPDDANVSGADVAVDVQFFEANEYFLRKG